MAGKAVDTLKVLKPKKVTAKVVTVEEEVEATSGQQVSQTDSTPKVTAPISPEVEAKDTVSKTAGGSVLPPSLRAPQEVQVAETPPVPTEKIAGKAYGIGSAEEEMVPLEKSNKKIYFFSLVVMLLVIFATVGVLLLRARKTEKDEIVTTVVVDTNESQLATPEPAKVEDTESTQLKREDIRLEILNGSGKTGLAADTAVTFEELDYKDIKTGNSPVISGSKLYVNKKVADKLDALLEDVETELKIASVAGEITDAELDARIVLGQ